MRENYRVPDWKMLVYVATETFCICTDVALKRETVQGSAARFQAALVPGRRLPAYAGWSGYSGVLVLGGGRSPA